MANFKLITKESQIQGKGLFANEDIPENSEIIEYTGERISDEESDRREIENEKTGLTYICYLDDNTYVDGAVRGSDAMYVNHCCDPNCKFVYKDGKIFYYSKRLIKKGEELTSDYAFPKDTKKEPCNCESKNCRKFMNEH